MEARRFSVTPIGTAHADRGSFFIEVAKPYRPVLQGLDGFSHVLVLWWGDTGECRSATACEKPCTQGPETIGIFTTRSRSRLPRCPASMPLLVSSGSRISMPTTLDTSVPVWCSHWPQQYEENEGFDWGAEFTGGE